MNDAADATAVLAQPTLPASLRLAFRGFKDQAAARRLGGVMMDCLQEISRVIDLSDLDGLTLAHDYFEALSALDRGFPDPPCLHRFEGEYATVGMTLPVLRGGAPKVHMVLRPEAIEGLLQPADHEDFRSGLYTLAHECAHVEVTACFNRAFPDDLAAAARKDFYETVRGRAACACWEEFAACWISASFAHEQAGIFEEVFLQDLSLADAKANEHIKAYLIHGDARLVIQDVYNTFGDLLKYAAYHLGNMLGQGKSTLDFPETVQALEGHWFRDAYVQLDLLLRQIASTLGRWQNRNLFDQLADLAEGVVAANALTVKRRASDGEVEVEVHQARLRPFPASDWGLGEHSS